MGDLPTDLGGSIARIPGYKQFTHRPYEVYPSSTTQKPRRYLDRWPLPFALNRRPPLPSTSIAPRSLLHSLATTALFLLFPSIYCVIFLCSNRCTYLPPLPSFQSQSQSSLPSMLLPLQPLPAYHHYCCPSCSPSIVDSASSSIAYCLSPPVIAVLPRSCTVTVAVVLPYRSPRCYRLHLLPPPLLSPPPICRLQPLRSVAISSHMPLPTPSPSVHNSIASATVLPTATHSFLFFSAISATIAVDTLPLKHQQLRATCCSLPTGRSS
ncbi:hypothetical protein B296_00054938 [Ensete ventricosum]|uniref:Uncharacterized protein n=1 Tax=Ensete ventricosum TaxID=4639 RepID=A0A426WXI1_ENSVE|nr:hypothetical protein B296_00054938 [Ensete ventricosum]